MQKRSLMVAIVLVSGGIGLGWWYKEMYMPRQAPVSHVQVVATFFPLADLARSIGGERVTVTQVVPEGIEPHEYEPSSQDVARMLSADVVVINGGGIDAWAERLIPDLEAEQVRVVRMSDVEPFLERNGVVDPHAWLDIERMESMAGALAEALTAKDESYAGGYARSMAEVQQQLALLHEEFASTLATCASHALFVAHDAFAYWEIRYTIKVHAVSGISPEAEPSVQDIVESVQEAKNLGATTIFFESPASAALAEVIAHEIGAQIDVLTPLETRTPEQVRAHATYSDLMRENLSALSRALSCQR